MSDLVLHTGNCPPEQYSEQFLQGMINRMVQGFHKYGLAKKNAAEVDWLKTAQQRIDKYIETGNTEWLIDAGNYFMCEFMFPKHPDAHYRATESGESPGRTNIDGTVVGSRKNPPAFHTHEGD